MTIIVAADTNWAIGNKDDLLVRIKEDHKNFKELTTGHTVILGRKTLCTFPGGLPLKNRTNIIMSRDSGYAVEGAKVAHSVDELLEMVKEIDDEVFVIGGGSVYKAAFKYAGRLYITHIKAVAKQADTFFPEIDPKEWEAVQTSEIFSDEENKIEYQFVVYQKKKLK